jgi:ArsR family transcriptional regulator, arsenate/arsenite/antimonite-responsive transcriptional repressor
MPAAHQAATPHICAPEPADPPLHRADAEQFARLLKALSDPTRLQILSLIEDSPGREACVCDLTASFEMTQPAISHHLKVLVDAGVLHRDKRGSWAWYSLVPAQLETIHRLLPGPRFLQSAAQS